MRAGAKAARAVPGSGVLLCAVAAALTVVPSLAESGGQEQPRVEGEYGLVVTRDSGRLAVRWLTGEPTTGYLEARSGERLLHRDTTPPGAGHLVRFPAPGSGPVRLRYGAADGDSLHETTLRLEEGSGAERRETVFGARDSLWVVGDVHGHYDRLRRLLANAGLVDAGGRWTGGDSHLVLLGDLMDRGPHVTRTLWFVYRLQAEAREAGGRVSVVLGNHEIMVLTGDHRYVPSRERLLATRYGITYGEMYHPRRSVLGEWLTRQPAAIRVGDVLLAHGGIGPAYLDMSVPELNDSLTTYVSEDLFEYWSDTTVQITPRDSAVVMRRVQFLFEGPSVFWYRDYARTDSAGETLRKLLRRRDARLHVIAHTPVPTIRQSYGDSVVLADLERPATEMLLLVREGEDYQRWVYGMEGVPRRLGGADSTAPGTRR